MGILVHDDVAFGWFWMALLATALIPITATIVVSAVWSFLSGKGSSSLRTDTDNSIKRTELDHSSAHRRRLWREQLFSTRNLILALGWIGLAIVSVCVLQHTEKELVSFDPYQILEIEVGSNVTEIKKAYRTLSAIHHPDKNPDDPSAEIAFIRISKAYQTLTDDLARENWERYGNPDGYAGTSVTIALPSFLADSKHELSILVVYFFIFFILLPIAVGLWWRSSSRLDPSGTKMDTLSIYFSTLNDGMQPKFLLEVLAASIEFKRLGHNRHIDMIQHLNRDLGEFMARPRIAGGKIAYINKTNILLHAYLLRMEIACELQDEMVYVMSKVHTLLKGIIDICLVRRLYRNLVSVIALSQFLTQAVWVYHSPLTQLPHIEEKDARHLLNRGKVKSLRKLLTMTPDAREAIFKPLFSDAEVAEIEKACMILPLVEMSVEIDKDESPFAPDDEQLEQPIRINDVIHFRIRLIRLNDFPDRVVPAVDRTKAVPDMCNRHYLSELDYEIDLINTKRDSEVDPSLLTEAHAPLFPFPKQENWVLFIFNSNKDLVNKDLVNIEKMSTLRNQQDVTTTIQMMDTGIIQFEFVLMCDSYIGLDVTQNFSIDVKKAPPPPKDVDELKDEEEEAGENLESEEEEGYWYYLGGASFWEGLLHMFLLYIIALLGADLLEARGYIQWNPFKAKKSRDPRLDEEVVHEDDGDDDDHYQDKHDL